jgi:hypothetical protein
LAAYRPFAQFQPEETVQSPAPAETVKVALLTLVFPLPDQFQDAPGIIPDFFEFDILPGELLQKLRSLTLSLLSTYYFQSFVHYNGLNRKPLNQSDIGQMPQHSSIPNFWLKVRPQPPSHF